MSLDYQEFAPGAALRPFAECFWSMTTRADVQHLVVPDGCMDIVFSQRQGLRVVGAMTKAQEFSLERDERLVGVRFHPGSAGLFVRVSGAEITDGIVPLEEIWGKQGRALHEQLANTTLDRDVSVLASALPVPEDGISSIRRATQAMMDSRGMVDVASLARQSNLSLRQFRRRCLEETGLTPKQLCRVLRFRHALGLLPRAPHWGWAQVALECGYYDQAHFIHEFRALSGYTPAQYARRDVPFLQSAHAANA